MGFRSWKGVVLGLTVTLGLAAPAGAAVSCTIFCQSFNPTRFYNQSSPSVSSCADCAAAANRLRCNGSDPSGYICSSGTVDGEELPVLPYGGEADAACTLP